MGRTKRGRSFLHLMIGALALAVACSAAGLAAGAQKTFATPEQAVKALVDAVRSSDAKALHDILGPGSQKLLSSGDKVADAQARRKFVAEYDAANKLDSDGDDRRILSVGTDDWEFPFPIVKRGKVWTFDASAGAQEILDRRIGANELNAIEVVRAYVDAQREYAEKDRNGDGVLEYAQKFLSSPGKQDGLYWPAAPGEDESPIGPLMVRARVQGYSTTATRNRRPFYGYYYKILKGQGDAAKGGAYDYVVNGRMIGGFALVAFPAQYGVSGVMSFIINQDDVVYQKDLGPDTAEIAEKMTLFNPDANWTKT
ncbi:MAG TPA: DUF2950 domain-containing protein [Stellaceae bacterium]|nr:DUF2950 domain-containing protein [Stellaceae bacterium]